MKIMVIDTNNGRIEIAVQDRDVIPVADLLESVKQVVNFYVDGINTQNQQKIYGVGGFDKWKSLV